MELGNKYNFRTISSTLLRGEYRGFELNVEKIKFKQLLRFNTDFGDLVTLRQQLILELDVPLLPIDKVAFFIFSDELGNEIALAEDWILTDTIALVTGVGAVYTFKGLSSSDLVLLNNTINTLGLTYTSEVN